MTDQRPAQPLARSEGLIVTELDGELLVYDAGRDFASALNGFAARVWRACDGASDARAIAAGLSADGGYVEPEAVERALATLAKAQLVELPDVAPPAKAAGSSRRQALLAVGAGAATVAIVTTIAAPAGAAGISCGGSGAPCVFPSDCCAGFTCGGGATCIGT